MHSFIILELPSDTVAPARPARVGGARGREPPPRTVATQDGGVARSAWDGRTDGALAGVDVACVAG